MGLDIFRIFVENANITQPRRRAMNAILSVVPDADARDNVVPRERVVVKVVTVDTPVRAVWYTCAVCKNKVHEPCDLCATED